VAKRISSDRWLFAATLLLVFIGLVMVFSASAVMASERFGSAYNFLVRQLAFAVVGLTAMWGAMHIDYRRYKHPAVVYSLLGITMALLVAVLFLEKTNNTHRWFRLGAFSFQPAELAKPAIVLYLAYFLETRIKAMDDWRKTLLPAVVPAILFAALIMKQPDLGTAIMVLGGTAVMLYIAGMRLRYFAYGFAASLPVLYFMIFRVAWRYDRILAFMNPYSDPQGRGFHIIQSLIAVGTGGVAGMGLMEGKQKLFYLPEPHTDFIYAVLAEETGLLGALAIVALFAVFAWRGMRTAFLIKDDYGRLLAAGITSMVVIQAFFNISVVLGLMPTKGIPLPFISYGGSSLAITLACVGILLNISRHAD
jgi:cell division protein FtsW